MKYERLRLIKNHKGFSLKSFKDELTNGFLGYFDEACCFRIINLSDFSIAFEQKFEEVLSVTFNEGSYYLIKNGGLIFRLKLDDRKLKEYYSIEEIDGVENSVGFLRHNLMVIGQSQFENYELKSQTSKILLIDSKAVMFSWSDMKDLLFVEGYNAYFQSKKGGEIFRVALDDGKLLWSLDLDNGAFGQRIFGQTQNILFLQRAVLKPDHTNLLAVDKGSGKILWETPHSFPYYNYNEMTNKLYGLSGNTFERINANTGERELLSELDDVIQISSHLTFLENTTLYFSAFTADRRPVFGAVEVNTGKLIFIQEVEIEGEISFRNSLDKPIAIKNRLYIRDAAKTLHIFERK